ncbi:MAG TPA: DUF1360 domain-containing protein [Candidatus Paceibacterota bacterium]
MRIHTWNVLLSLFFAVLLFYGVWWLAASRLIFYDIPVRDLVLISLATFRLVRLFTYDIITQFIRDWFVNARPNSFGHTLGALLNCPWCTGLWFSFIVVFFYFATPFSWPIILVLALAALASLMQVLSNWIGWSAQLRKLEAQAFERGG